MIIIGLTGSIGMGKTTTSGMFRACGIPVQDADATVHRLYAGRAAPVIEREFPGSTSPSGVDRAKLSQMIVGRPDQLKKLESLVHPLVREEEASAVAAAKAAGHRQMVLDIPLLLETGANRRCDVIVVVTADAVVQRERVLVRPGMTEEKFEALLANQWSDSRKRRAAHFLVNSGYGHKSAARQVYDIVRAVGMIKG